MEKDLFERLLKSAEQMVAIEKGELEVPAENIRTFKIPDVKTIRSGTRLKQAEFAEALGVSTALVQSWETRRRVPNGSSRKLLLILEKHPGLIQELQAV